MTLSREDRARDHPGDRVHVCAIGVMAKAPSPGRSKTRLCPPLRHDQAAALSAAFLRDVTENIAAAARDAPILGMVAHAPAGSEPLFTGHVAHGTGFVLADGVTDLPAEIPPGVTGFGRCLLHAIQTMLARGFGAACVLNSDSPNLPTALLARAATILLADGDRVVLGPADDGGYYLLGVKAPHARLFANIAWSTDSVADATRARAQGLGLEMVELPTWYDVDDPDALTRLARDLTGDAAGGALPPYPAHVTARALRQMGILQTGSAETAVTETDVAETAIREARGAETGARETDVHDSDIRMTGRIRAAE